MAKASNGPTTQPSTQAPCPQHQRKPKGVFPEKVQQVELAVGSHGAVQPV